MVYLCSLILMWFFGNYFVMFVTLPFIYDFGVVWRAPFDDLSAIASVVVFVVHCLFFSLIFVIFVWVIYLFSFFPPYLLFSMFLQAWFICVWWFYCGSVGVFFLCLCFHVCHWFCCDPADLILSQFLMLLLLSLIFLNLWCVIVGLVSLCLLILRMSDFTLYPLIYLCYGRIYISFFSYFSIVWWVFF